IIGEKNPDVRFTMVGRDVADIATSKSTKTLLLEKLDPNTAKKIYWPGSLPYEKVKDEISKASVVILTSFAEALPMTWLEAMAMEKALVTSNIGRAREIMIDGNTGFTVDPKDHQLFAEKILQFIIDPTLAVKMG